MALKEVRISQVADGMIAGREIVTNDGTLLVENGAKLTSELIGKLRQWQVTYISVWEPDDVPVTTPLVVYEKAKVTAERAAQINAGLQRGDELQEQLIGETRQLLNTLRLKGEVDYPAAKKMVDQLLTEVLHHPEVLSTLLTVRHYDTYLMNHSLNVSVLAVMTGHILGLERSDLQALGESALLHDVGMTLIPAGIWNKDGVLSDNERFQVQKHPIFSADIVEKVYQIDANISRTIYQHHERADGSGYPKGIGEARISRLARILAVADTYDAMSNPRPYRHAHIPHDSIKTLVTLANTALDREAVRAFITHMSLFPVGSVLRLNSGMLAVVIKVNREAPLRPQVKVCRWQDGQYTADGPYLDLQADPALTITESITDHAVIDGILSTLPKPVPVP